MALHPLLARVRRSQPRLSTEVVMQLPYADLVRYCDRLLDQEAALEILIAAFDPGSQHQRAVTTHCPQGHEYTPENTAYHGGSRRCRQCAKERMRRWQEQRRKNISRLSDV